MSTLAMELNFHQRAVLASAVDGLLKFLTVTGKRAGFIWVLF